MKDLEETVQQVREASNADLIRDLQYVPPAFSEDDAEDLLRFWSNADLPVFTAKHQGILSGSFVSKESRASTDLRTTSLRIFRQSSEVQEALRHLNIPDATRTLGMEFYERVFDEYGDDSVAQLVPGTVAFEGMSFLYSMQVSHHRFIPKIGKSSRYRNFSKRDEAGNFQYVVDPFIVDAGLEDIFRTTANNLFVFYEGLADSAGSARQELLDEIKKTLPYDQFREGVQRDLQRLSMAAAQSTELEGAYERTLVPMRLDIARHLLPLATISATAALMNGQSARELLLHSYTTPRAESLIFGELLRRELEPSFGPLLSDVDPHPQSPHADKQEKKQQRSVAWRNFMGLQREAKHELGRYVSQNLSPTSPFSAKIVPDSEFPEYLVEAHKSFHRVRDVRTGLEIEVGTKDNLTDLVSAILRESYPHVSLGRAKELAHALPVPEQREKALKYAATELRKNRRHKPGRAFEAVNFEVSIQGITVGELRDLRRHRTQTNLEPLYFTPAQGFYLSPALLNTAAAKLLEQHYAEAAKMYDSIAEKVNLETAQTILPLATKVTANINMNLRQAHHFIELRTQPGAHGNYLKICQMLYVGMKHEFPLVKETMTYVNKETEIDYGRAIQEIRTLRRAK